MKHMGWVSVLVVVSAGMTGCVSITNSKLVGRQLQLVSAGHTGCLPDENQISNVNFSSPTGGGTWNATCKGKVYLCSEFSNPGDSESYSCAPVAN